MDNYCDKFEINNKLDNKIHQLVMSDIEKNFPGCIQYGTKCCSQVIKKKQEIHRYIMKEYDGIRGIQISMCYGLVGKQMEHLEGISYTDNYEICMYFNFP